ncbi:MAG TPA: hypothetical protein VMW10_09015 [Alphaproteobacteria bacterium]|nr:hypothetical protein [Alphaproteobacteria bacterium]
MGDGKTIETNFGRRIDISSLAENKPIACGSPMVIQIHPDFIKRIEDLERQVMNLRNAGREMREFHDCKSPFGDIICREEKSSFDDEYFLEVIINQHKVEVEECPFCGYTCDN